MNLAQLATSLRDTSDRYDGIPEYLSAAGELDRAASAFFRHQDLESLAALNSAVARAKRLNSEFSKPMASKTCRIDVVRHVDFRTQNQRLEVVGATGIEPVTPAV